MAQRTIEEYAGAFGKGTKKGSVGWDQIERVLEKELGWTPDGACAIANLAKRYGAFMLRNALALATVMEVEDGELGY